MTHTELALINLCDVSVSMNPPTVWIPDNDAVSDFYMHRRRAICCNRQSQSIWIE